MLKGEGLYSTSAGAPDKMASQGTATLPQSALYGETGGLAGDSSLATHQSSRSFFIIDKSQMVGERDTVEGAKVVYLPESEFRKVRESLA